MSVFHTDRLNVRRFRLDDAPFVYELLNMPSWLRFIGDRGAHTLEDARGYLRNGPLASYRARGYGLWMVETREHGTPLGMCGLVERSELPHPDIGFAFLERHWSHGYAYEAAAGTLVYAAKTLAMKRVLAITTLDNDRSARLLEKLGMRCESTVRLPNDPEELRLYAISFGA
jgi:RimJ/RimL family protein N-acetyltransferase